ncbi:MAG: beta strand repeat-containing protein [Rudaea sp.]
MLSRNHALVAAMAVLCTLFCAVSAHAEDEGAPRVMSAQEYAAAAGIPPVFTVTPEDHHDTLPSLRDAVVPDNSKTKITHFEGLIPLPPGSTDQSDGAVQRIASPTRNTPTTLLNFDGVGDGFTGPSGTFSVNSAPPDTNGAVGASQYVSLVNSDLAVFDKTTGNVTYGPVSTNTLWSGFGGLCQADNDGDGVVIYDRAANRWVISQFAVTSAGTISAPYLQCVAVSQTSDATGAWNRYAFSYGTVFPDYPKMGAWPDAYYETFNMFNGNTFAGAKLCAYDRTNMLAGNAATQQCYQLSSSYGGVLPSDLDGATSPPANSPNYLINFGTSKLNLWKFHVDWTTPSNSTLSSTPTAISVAGFSPACSGSGGGAGTCISQPGTSQQLDSLSDRMMFRLAYRNFGTHESLVASHSVKLGTGTSQYSGVRWYEIRSPGTTPTVYQQSTFAPDTSFRWMPSIAMDGAGDIAVGYSVSNASAVYPSVRYAGRVPTDVSGTLETEQSLFAGTASQSGVNGLTRWGDYSAMTVDPVDDCTFWYTNEYIPTTGEFNWKTRIGSFKFPGCTVKQNQTITFPNPGPLTYSPSGTFALTATASSGLTVTYTSTTPSVCTVAGSTGTMLAAGTCTINADQAGNATYNAAPTVTDNITINKASQTIAFTSTAPAGAVVGGATYTVTATGGASGNAVTFTIDATSSGVCTISGSTVSFTATGTCTIDANQAGNTNYNAAPQAQQAFAVGPGSQTITFTSTAPAGAAVGGATYTVTATGGASGNPVTFAIDVASSGVCTISGSTVSFTGTGTCTIDANQAGNTNYNAAPQAQQSFAVGKGSQTITFPNPGAQTYSAGGTFAVSATATSGLAVTFTSTTTGVCTVAGSTVTIVSAGTCTINADQSGNTNYSAAPTVSDNITINKANQAIAFPNPGAQTYSPGGTFAVSATATSGLAVAFSSTTPGVCTVAGSTVTIVSAGTCTIAANQAGNTNYSAAPTVSDNITINPASQTITFTSTPPGSPAVNGTYNVTATGGASGNSVTITIDSTSNSVCTISGSTVTFNASGNCLIDANQAGNANYAAAPQAQQSVAVGVASQTITFPNPGPVTYSPSGTFALTATGGASGNPVTYVSNTTGVCTATGSTATIVSAGTCSITASQSGNASYGAATPVTDPITINPAGQTIAFISTPPASPAYGGSYGVSATGGASGNPVSFSIDAGSTAGACSISGSTVSFTGTGTCIVDANQAGNANYTAAAQQQQSFAIAAANQTITFTSTAPAPGVLGGPTYTVTATASSTLPVTLSVDAGSVSVCSLNGSVSGSTVSYISTGTCTIDANQAGDSNYNAAPQAQQAFTVGLGTVSLVFTTQPADVAQGTTQGTIAVTEENQYGYVITSDNSSTVNFSVTTCGGPASLGSATMSNGVATLANSTQRFYTVAAGLTAGATSSGTFSGTAASATFNVMSNPGLIFSDGFDGCRL